MSALAFATRIYSREGISLERRLVPIIMRRRETRHPLGLMPVKSKGRRAKVRTILKRAGLDLSLPSETLETLIWIRDEKLTPRRAREILNRRSLRELLGLPALPPSRAEQLASSLGIPLPILETVINLAKENKSTEVEAMAADFILSHELHIRPSRIEVALKALSKLEADAKRVAAETRVGNATDLENYYHAIRLYLAAAYVNIKTRLEDDQDPAKVLARLMKNKLRTRKLGRPRTSARIAKLLFPQSVYGQDCFSLRAELAAGVCDYFNPDNLDHRAIFLFESAFEAVPNQAHALGAFVGTAVAKLARPKFVLNNTTLYLSIILALAYETRADFNAYQAGQLTRSAGRVLFEEDNMSFALLCNGVNRELDHDSSRFFNGALGETNAK